MELKDIMHNVTYKTTARKSWWQDCYNKISGFNHRSKYDYESIYRIMHIYGDKTNESSDKHAWTKEGNDENPVLHNIRYDPMLQYPNIEGNSKKYRDMVAEQRHYRWWLLASQST